MEWIPININNISSFKFRRMTYTYYIESKSTAKYFSFSFSGYEKCFIISSVSWGNDAVTRTLIYSFKRIQNYCLSLETDISLCIIWHLMASLEYLHYTGSSQQYLFVYSQNIECTFGVIESCIFIYLAHKPQLPVRIPLKCVVYTYSEI